ncbi:MAG TPA: hypothetical protein VF212_06050 [Longimicrobiales bacterium]
MVERAAAPGVRQGAVVAMRLYDVADAVDLSEIEAIAARLAPAAVTRIRLRRADPKAIAFGVPPIEIGLRPIELELDGAWHTIDAIARVYDFGVVSLALRLLASDLAWDEFVALSGAIKRTVSGPDAARLWTELLERLLELIGPALGRPSFGGLEEDYQISVVREFDGPVLAEELLGRVDLAPLLSGEARPLSDGARNDLLRHTFSYHRDDLAVLTWDHAFLYEPSGDTDVADVLEVANAQLLEMRYYDELLDRELPRMYDRVEAARKGVRGLTVRRYADLARDLHGLVAEVTELTEKAENALKVTEDVYLARIYGAALELFRVRTWTGSVDRKLAIIRDTYQMLYDEAATGRAEILEATIVLLIVLEIILAFVFR